MPVAPERARWTFEDGLAAITFPAPSAGPPTRLPWAPSKTSTPSTPLPMAPEPVASVPIQFPSTVLPVAEAAPIRTPVETLPEMMFRSTNDVPPTTTPLAPSIMMPATPLPRAAMPVASVPSRLPTTFVPSSARAGDLDALEPIGGGGVVGDPDAGLLVNLHAVGVAQRRRAVGAEADQVADDRGVRGGRPEDVHAEHVAREDVAGQADGADGRAGRAVDDDAEVVG